MAVEHKLSIFRGRLTFKSVTQKIWGVLIFLSIVTIVEVVLGIFKPVEGHTSEVVFLTALPFFTMVGLTRV